MEFTTTPMIHDQSLQIREVTINIVFYMVSAIIIQITATQKYPAIKTKQRTGIGWEEPTKDAQTNDGVGWMTSKVIKQLIN